MTHTYIYICIYTYTLLHVGTTALHHNTRTTWIQGFVPQCGSTAALWEYSQIMGSLPKCGCAPTLREHFPYMGSLPMYGETANFPQMGSLPIIWGDFVSCMPCP